MDHTDNQLRACIKALNEVIGPAMAADAQAGEQLFLVTDYLGFLRSRLDNLLDRDRFEVRHYVTMGTALADDAAACSPSTANALADAVSAAESVLHRADARMPEMKAAAANVAAVITRLVREAAGADEAVRSRIERTVVELSEDKIQLDRTWHAPQGLEPDPGSLVPLDQALGIA